MLQPPSAQVADIVRRALAEDLALGDVTTDSLIPAEWQGHADIVAKEAGVLAGLPVAIEVFHQVDPALRFAAVQRDGAPLARGSVVASIDGLVASILKAERTALNFLQRLSGIATLTAKYVEAAGGLPVRILDTRKTGPGLRLLEKYAVRAGGGHNHRYNLGDGILIKDNHLAALRSRGIGLDEVVRRMRAKAPHTLRVEVEVETVEEARQALEAGADVLLLDNMGLAEMREVVALARGRALTEASGGIRLETVRAVAETGVDFISVGALTHSAKALDLSLEMLA